MAVTARSPIVEPDDRSLSRPQVAPKSPPSNDPGFHPPTQNKSSRTISLTVSGTASATVAVTVSVTVSVGWAMPSAVPGWLWALRLHRLRRFCHHVRSSPSQSTHQSCGRRWFNGRGSGGRRCLVECFHSPHPNPQPFRRNDNSQPQPFGGGQRCTHAAAQRRAPIAQGDSCPCGHRSDR
jgi:hypothetical protein